MKIKGIIFEDFVNYKKPSMTIQFPYCDFKCNKEYGNNICQNSDIIVEETFEVNPHLLIKQYLNNDITEAIVFQGLEPFMSFKDVYNFIYILRNKNQCDDDIVIYTGYYPTEIEKEINILKRFNNIIIKFGRFIPNDESHYDETLGIYLASNNQFGLRIS